MAIEIREIHSKRELKRFIQFANDLYADCPYYCPPLFFDEMNCFDVEKNPALEVCEYQLWMAVSPVSSITRPMRSGTTSMCGSAGLISLMI